MCGKGALPDKCCAAQVFMLSSDALLDANTMKRVLASGHSRVPVHRPENRCSSCSLPWKAHAFMRMLLGAILDTAPSELLQSATLSGLMGALARVGCQRHAALRCHARLVTHLQPLTNSPGCMQEGHHRVDTGERAGDGEF